MKSKAIFIAAMVLTIAVSIFLMVYQRQQIKEQRTTHGEQVSETDNPTATPELSMSTPVPTPTKTLPSPSGSPVPLPNPGEPVFSIYINGKTIPVDYGIDGDNPGWMEASVWPGQDGMCVIDGINNPSSLRILETVEAGDSVIVTMPDNVKYTYIVTQVQAFEQATDLVLNAPEGKSIALIAAYPLTYSGGFPGRYLVIGQFDAEAAN